MMKIEVEAIKELTSRVDGWLGDGEGRLLYTLAKNCPSNNVIVEIGSWKGKSTIWLGKGSQAGHNVKVYAIDPHVGSEEHAKDGKEVWTFDEFKKNIEGAQVDDVIVPIVKTSKDAVTDIVEPVGLVFIDGAHDYESVKLDFELWSPKIVDGGIVVFHDTDWPGVRKVVKDLVCKSRSFGNAGFETSIIFAQKVRKNTLKDRAFNRYVPLMRELTQYAWGLNLPKPVKAVGKKILKAVN